MIGGSKRRQGKTQKIKMIYKYYCKVQTLDDDTFTPLQQETFSNIRYTGMGYIPTNFIKFHSQWKNNDNDE